MSSRSRRRAIVKALESGVELSVRELASQFDTSEITIRRDLAELAAAGSVVRTHGGAELPDRSSFHHKNLQNASAKKEIGKQAARLVRNGDVIFMDCGSTVLQMCAFLKDRAQLTVITNSLPVVNELAGQPGLAINLVGGELDVERRAVHGTMALEHIGRYKADKAFLGVDGISAENGLSARSEKEASITLAMSERSFEVCLLCDASKLERDSYLQFAPLTLADTLVTDRGADQSLLQQYSTRGLRIISPGDTG